MTAPELDALIERLEYATKADTGTGYLKRAALWREAAAALVQLREENARLQSAHDHQYAVAGTMLRTAERAEAEVAQLQSRQRWRDEAQITHYEGCWRDHYGCAMERIKALEGERDALKRIKCFNCGMLPQIDAVKGKP